jgi:hypothetical protein
MGNASFDWSGRNFGIDDFVEVWKLIHVTPSGLERPLWPLVLVNAGFLYLWWLSALLFDLIYTGINSSDLAAPQ